MPIEQSLEELKKYAKDLASIGNVNDFIKTNKSEFISKWSKVMQYYNYIMKNSPSQDLWMEALNIVDDIRYDNPSLDEWVNEIISPKKDKDEQQKNSNEENDIDISTLSNRIESYVSEIKNMRLWDENEISDISWKLNECKNMLISSQSSFEPSTYSSLMEDINKTLEKINRFNNMVNSNNIDDIKKM